jgi:hypothetical protein
MAGLSLIYIKTITDYLKLHAIEPSSCRNPAAHARAHARDIYIYIVGIYTSTVSIDRLASDRQCQQNHYKYNYI